MAAIQRCWALLKARAAAFGANREGIAATEFALITPLLVLLLLGVTELGVVLYDRTDMHSSLRNGAQYFMAGGDDMDAAKAIVERSWSMGGETSSLDVVTYCECGGAAAQCGVLCPDETVPDVFRELQASALLDGIFGTYEITANETVRTR